MHFYSSKQVITTTVSHAIYCWNNIFSCQTMQHNIRPPSFNSVTQGRRTEVIHCKKTLCMCQAVISVSTYRYNGIFFLMFLYFSQYQRYLKSCRSNLYLLSPFLTLILAKDHCTPHLTVCSGMQSRFQSHCLLDLPTSREVRDLWTINVLSKASYGKLYHMWFLLVKGKKGWANWEQSPADEWK